MRQKKKDGRQQQAGTAIDCGGTGLKGSVTIEMAYILPAVITILMMIIYTVFYYHDKNILHGAAGETAILGVQHSRFPDGAEKDLQGFYRERVHGKLILLRLTSVDVEKSRDWVTVTAFAERRGMRVEAKQRANVTVPEKKIREKRWVKSLTDQEE